MGMVEKIKKIKVVFGCPGDKGINRRRDMGLLAGEYADYIYLTAEDPGHSKVSDICNDIIKYIEKYHKNYEVIEDRKEAILKGLKMLEKDDILLVLGKGHEDYQIIGREKIHFDDAEIIKNYN